MYKLRKDKSNLVSEMRLRCGLRPYYFDVYLWADASSFFKNVYSDVTKDAVACMLAASSIVTIRGSSMKEKVKPKLGEIHFRKNEWDIEAVAHEVMHASIHRMRRILPRNDDVNWQYENSEEIVCYEHGEWVDIIYRWLWKLNPSKKWRKNAQVPQETSCD